MAKAEVMYAGFGVRLAASLIDGLVLAAIGMVAGKIGVGKLYQHIDAVVTLIYIVFFWVNRDGATLGKQVMKIKVVAENGESLGYKRAVLRYLGYIVSVMGMFLGFLWIIWDPKKQGWHDKIAQTVVIRE